MGPVEVDIARLEAGAAYLKALRLLGLEPDGLFWARDEIERSLVLVLVTRYFDIVGPAALSSLLFKAYNAAATPREIDPFVVRIHSPDHRMIKGFISAMDDFVKRKIAKITPDATISTGTLTVPLGEAYIWKDVRRPKIDLMRKWGFISRKVDNLAA